MKYLVVSCVEREIELEAVCDTYEEARERLKECFLDYQRYCGYSEEELNKLSKQFDENTEFEEQDCGLINDGYVSAWSNSDHNHAYDIKIIEQY